MVQKQLIRKGFKDYEGSDKIMLSEAMLARLISIIVHADEMLGPDGRELDKAQVQIGLQDKEVQSVIKEMGVLAPLPRSSTYSSSRGGE